MRAIGVFGGTFDPVHIGHVQMALSAISHLELDEIRMIPCHQPPHRDQPRLSSQQRLHLLELATQGHSSLIVDGRELNRAGPSWTVDTLKDLREEQGDDVSLVLLMGADAYSKLMTWHEWRELPKLAHIGVFLRPGYVMPKEGVLFEWLELSMLGGDTQLDIHNSSSGLIVGLNQPQIDVSATVIREQLASGASPEGLDPAVRNYIMEHRLYSSRSK